MNEPTKETVIEKSNKPTEGQPGKADDDKQRGFGVVELLFAASTICTTILAAGIPTPKIPKSASD